MSVESNDGQFLKQMLARRQGSILIMPEPVPDPRNVDIFQDIHSLLAYYEPALHSVYQNKLDRPGDLLMQDGSRIQFTLPSPHEDMLTYVRMDRDDPSAHNKGSKPRGLARLFARRNTPRIVENCRKAVFCTAPASDMEFYMQNFVDADFGNHGFVNLGSNAQQSIGISFDEKGKINNIMGPGNGSSYVAYNFTEKGISRHEAGSKYTKPVEKTYNAKVIKELTALNPYLTGEIRQRGDEIARIMSELPLSEVPLTPHAPIPVQTPVGSGQEKPSKELERKPVETRRFTQEARDALEKDGYMIYCLTGQTIKEQKEAGKPIKIVDLLTLAPGYGAYCFTTGESTYYQWGKSMTSEAAINPQRFFYQTVIIKTFLNKETW